VVEAYAPHAFTSHLKDMGVQEYQDGFPAVGGPLGDGFLDLPKMIATLRRAQPQIHFNLEMITRDPLKVTCLTEKYWATMGDTPAGRLAETLAMVRANAAKKTVAPGNRPCARRKNQTRGREREEILRLRAGSAWSCRPRRGFTLIPVRWRQERLLALEVRANVRMPVDSKTDYSAGLSHCCGAGCVRRTSRSAAEREETLNHSNALPPAMPLRLRLHPQSRS